MVTKTRVSLIRFDTDSLRSGVGVVRAIQDGCGPLGISGNDEGALWSEQVQLLQTDLFTVSQCLTSSFKIRSPWRLEDFYLRGTIVNRLARPVRVGSLPEPTAIKLLVKSV